MPAFRRFSIGPRLLTGFMLVVLLAAVAVATFLAGVSQERDATHRVDELLALKQVADQAAFYNADMSGWQAFYVLDSLSGPGPAEAVSPESFNRKSFVEEQQQIEAWLPTVDTTAMTDSERVSWASVVAAWKVFFDEDARVADLVAQGTPQAEKQVWTSLNEGDSMDAWTAIVDATNALRESLAQRLADAVDARETGEARAARIGILVSAAAGILALLIAWLVTRSITRPLKAVQHAAEAVAAGDLTVRAADDGRDEVAHVADALDASTATLHTLVTELASTGTTLAAAGEQLRSAASRLEETAATTASRAEVAAGNATMVAGGVAEVRSSVESVTASIDQVAEAANEAATLSSAAADQARNSTVELVDRLSAATGSIGDAVVLIRGIAHQTNLLALNATIEAARAGAAGRSFAVVAGEVKDLAQRAAEATEGVTSSVAQIQHSVDAVTGAIAEIAGVIEGLNEKSTAIAREVDEQRTSTRAIDDVIIRTAVNAEAIGADADAVLAAAGSTRDGAGEGRRAADDVADASSRLRQLTSRYTV